MSKRGGVHSKWVAPKAPSKGQQKKQESKKNETIRCSTSQQAQSSTPMPNKQPQPMAVEPDISMIVPALSISTVSSEADCSSTGAGRNSGHRPNKENLDDEHDKVMNAYARYLQAVMLDIQAKKALQRVKSEAVVTITALANHTYELKEKFHKLKTLLDTVERLKVLKQQVDQQYVLLDDLNCTLGHLENYYTLSNCVDACSHKLPVREIATEKAEIESLVEKLATSNKLIKELASKVSFSEVSEDAESLTNIKEILAEAVDSVHECEESFQLFTNITIHTTSLQIENIQDNV